ncbi:MAG: hypothetical protein WDO24_16635 [Pseudomonadota bacterium]
MIREVRLLAVSALLTVAGPALSEVSRIDCLSPGDQRRIADEFAALLKARGLSDSDKLAEQVGALTRDMMAQSAAAQACIEQHDEDDDTVGGQCQSERQAAKATESRLEAWSSRMEEIGQAMETIRARYKACS